MDDYPSGYKTISASTGASHIGRLHAFGERVFFVGNDGIHGAEPWISDGTTRGTMLARDIAAGRESSSPDWITVAGDLVFFAADDGVHGRELWASDGTEPGTFMVEDIVAPGTGAAGACPNDGSCPGGLTVAGDRLFFAATDEDGDREPWALHLPD